MRVHKIKPGQITKGRSYKKTFKKCIGTGRMSLALREDYMENLRTVQREIGFDYIRGHGLFNDEMGVFRKSVQVGADGRIYFDEPLYVFKNILRIFDNFLSVGIRPFVEFGFMPSDMAAGDDSVFWWQGNVTEPGEMREWQLLVKRFMEACIDYYGEEEVKQWYFEVWNEPCANFWKPTKGKPEEAYWVLYEATASVVRHFGEEYRIGGPATQNQGLEWIPRFIDHCENRNIPLDYVSHHIYTGKSREFIGEFAYLKHMNPREALEKFEYVKGLSVDGTGENYPLHITEWNTSFSCIDPVHDKAWNAAYVAYLLTHVDHLVESYAYWVFCDVFEEADIPRALFHGGFGLLTENGIRKPVFHAFAFANRLKGQIIQLDDISCVTIDDDRHMAVLLFNPCFDPSEGDVMEIELSLPWEFDEAFVTKEAVDEERGNAHTAWVKMGRLRWPKAEAMEVIHKAQFPSFETERIQCVDGEVKIISQLPVNGIQFIEIKNVEVERMPYVGLKEA